MTFTNTSLAQGRVGTAYTVTISTQSGVGPFTYDAKDLPPGLTFNGQTGVISGVPAAAGTFFVTFTAHDAGENNTVITTLPLVVLPAASDFHFTTVLLDNGQVGTAYSDSWITASAAGAVVYSASGLAPGLAIALTIAELVTRKWSGLVQFFLNARRPRSDTFAETNRLA